MSRNIFSKAFDGLFGPGSPIPNEPTIDYENTIHSFKSNPNIESSSSYNYPREYTNYSSRDDSSYGIRLNDTNYNTKRVPSRYIYDDSDDELNKDMSQVYNQFNENSSKLSNDLKIPGPIVHMTKTLIHKIQQGVLRYLIDFPLSEIQETLPLINLYKIVMFSRTIPLS